LANEIEKGALYVVATPIGNLSDITERALKVLSDVDFIAAEDTRVSGMLLSRFDIKKSIVNYFEHNKKVAGKKIIEDLLCGQSCALVTDAGTPAISDPGEDLVKLCIENDLNITSIPGCVAGVNALILSGLSTKRFAFEGFLSVNKRHRHEHLESVKNDTHTLIFYEAPHKLIYTLKDMLDILGNRKIALCRELTKLHEEIIRTTLEEAQSLYTEKSPKGEYVIIIEGAEKAAEDIWWQNITAKEHVEKYINDGDDPKDAIKKAAKDRNVPKRDVYNEFHGI